MLHLDYMCAPSTRLCQSCLAIFFQHQLKEAYDCCSEVLDIWFHLLHSEVDGPGARCNSLSFWGKRSECRQVFMTCHRPKQYTIIRELTQTYHRLALFDLPKLVIQWFLGGFKWQLFLPERWQQSFRSWNKGTQNLSKAKDPLTLIISH